MSARYTPSSVDASCFNVTDRTHLGLDVLILGQKNKFAVSLSLSCVYSLVLFDNPASYSDS